MRMESMLNYQPCSVEDMRQYTDEYMAYVSQSHRNAQRHFLVEEIDTLLRTRENGYIEKLLVCINHPEYANLSNFHYSLLLLRQMYELCGAEIKEGKLPLLCRLESLEDVERIYNTTYFLLRRIEMNLPAQYCIMLADWVKDSGISAAFLLCIIEKGRIIAKIHTANIAAGILLAKGCTPEAEKLLVWVREEKEKNQG